MYLLYNYTTLIYLQFTALKPEADFCFVIVYLFLAHLTFYLYSKK